MYGTLTSLSRSDTSESSLGFSVGPRKRRSLRRTLRRWLLPKDASKITPRRRLVMLLDELSDISAYSNVGEFHDVVFEGDYGLYQLYSARCSYSAGLVTLKSYSRAAIKTRAKCILADINHTLKATQVGTLLRVLGVVSKAEEVVLVLHYIGLCQLQSLKTLRGPFRDEGALANIVIAPIIEALAGLHRLNVIHCNVTPQNVVLKPKGEANLMGMECSADMTEPFFPSNITCMSFEYTPPELAKPLEKLSKSYTQGSMSRSRGRGFLGLTTQRSYARSLSMKNGAESRTVLVAEAEVRRALTPAVDTWQVGCLAYELLVGHPPYMLPTENAWNVPVHLLLNYDAPLTFPPHVSAEFVDFVTLALAPVPELRPTMADLIMHPWIDTPVEVDEMDLIIEKLESVVAGHAKAAGYADGDWSEAESERVAVQSRKLRAAGSDRRRGAAAGASLKTHGSWRDRGDGEMPHLGAEMTARPKGKLAKKASFLAKTGSQRGFFVPVEEELPQKDTSESPAEGASPTGVGARPPPARTASLLQRIVSHRSGLVSAESTRAKTQSVGLAVVSPDAAAGGRAGNNHERRALALQMSLDQSRRRARRGWVVPQMSGWASEAPPQGTIDHPRNLASFRLTHSRKALLQGPSSPGLSRQGTLGAAARSKQASELGAGAEGDPADGRRQRGSSTGRPDRVSNLGERGSQRSHRASMRQSGREHGPAPNPWAVMKDGWTDKTAKTMLKRRTEVIAAETERAALAADPASRSASPPPGASNAVVPEESLVTRLGPEESLVTRLGVGPVPNPSGGASYREPGEPAKELRRQISQQLSGAVGAHVRTAPTPVLPPKAEARAHSVAAAAAEAEVRRQSLKRSLESVRSKVDTGVGPRRRSQDKTARAGRADRAPVAHQGVQPSDATGVASVEAHGPLAETEVGGGEREAMGNEGAAFADGQGSGRSGSGEEGRPTVGATPASGGSEGEGGLARSRAADSREESPRSRESSEGGGPAEDDAAGRERASVGATVPLSDASGTRPADRNSERAVWAVRAGQAVAEAGARSSAPVPAPELDELGQAHRGCSAGDAGVTGKGDVGVTGKGAPRKSTPAADRAGEEGPDGMEGHSSLLPGRAGRAPQRKVEVVGVAESAPSSSARKSRVEEARLQTEVVSRQRRGILGCLFGPSTKDDSDALLSEKRVDQGGRKSKAEVLRTSRAHNSFVRGRGKGVYAKSRNEGVSGGTPDGASRLSSTAVRSGKEATPSRSRQGTTRGRGVSAQDGVPPGVAGSSRAPPGAGTGARSAVEPGRLGRVPAALAATAVEAEAGAAPPTPRTGAVRRVLRRLSVGLMGRDAEAGDGGSQREDGQPEKSGGQGAWHAGRRASVDGQEGGSGGTKARAEGAAEARAERKKERLGGGQLALVADTDRGGMLRTVMSGYAPPRGARYHNRDKDEATADVQGSMIISDEVVPGCNTRGRINRASMDLAGPAESPRLDPRLSLGVGLDVMLAASALGARTASGALTSPVERSPDQFGPSLSSGHQAAGPFSPSLSAGHQAASEASPRLRGQGRRAMFGASATTPGGTPVSSEVEAPSAQGSGRHQGSRLAVVAV